MKHHLVPSKTNTGIYKCKVCCRLISIDSPTRKCPGKDTFAQLCTLIEQKRKYDFIRD